MALTSFFEYNSGVALSEIAQTLRKTAPLAFGRLRSLRPYFDRSLSQNGQVSPVEDVLVERQKCLQDLGERLINGESRIVSGLRQWSRALEYPAEQRQKFLAQEPE